jgi:hypothetical protein
MTTELSPPTPQTRTGSASSVFKPGVFSAWDVCLGAGRSKSIHFIREGEPSSVFGRKTIIGFFRCTPGHRASLLIITKEKMERINALAPTTLLDVSTGTKGLM